MYLLQGLLYDFNLNDGDLFIVEDPEFYELVESGLITFSSAETTT